ncbi:MAG: putative basic amino acid antiporter YfcC [Oceanicaulis sp.]
MTTPVPSPGKPQGATPGKPSRLPDSYLILFTVAVLAFAATFVFTPGAFELAPAAEGERARIDPGSYTAASGPDPAPVFGTAEDPGFLNFLFEGLISGDRYSATVGLMAFLLVVGGAFGVIMRTGAVERILKGVLSSRDKPSDLLVAILFVVFSLGGAVFGMGEEAIVLCLIVVPALIRSGYDSITGVLACYAATQIGFATSWMNPFSVVVAQSIAELPALSGLGLRVVMWGVFTMAGAAFAYAYARKVRLNPESSLAHGSDTYWRTREQELDTDETPVSLGDYLVLAVLGAGVVWIAWGVAAQGYYLAEIAAQFFAIGLVGALIGRAFGLNAVTGNDLVDAFRDGAMQLLPAALIVAAAKGVVILLGGDDPTEPSLLNAALNGAGQLTGALPDWLAALGMYFSQSAINLLVVSGSGQAALTMPLMAPLADLSGVSRQTAVLAFQLGDGLTNIIVPASAALMGCLAAARLDWAIWVRFVWKPMLGLIALASAFVLIAQAIGYS